MLKRQMSLQIPPEKLQDSIKWRIFAGEIINTISSNEKNLYDDYCCWFVNYGRSTGEI